MIDQQLIDRSLPLLLAAAIALYPFTASWEFGLGYYLYAMPLGLSGVVVIWRWGVPRDVPYVKWLVAYSVVVGIVSTIFAVLGYGAALRYPPIYVVISLGVVGFLQGLKSYQDGFANHLHYAISAATAAFFVFWLLRDYGLGEFYAYPARVNQFAFWCLLAMLLLDVVTKREHKGWYHWFLMVVLSFLTITTLSRAATLGVICYWMFGLIMGSSVKRMAIAGGSLVIVMAALFYTDALAKEGYYTNTFIYRYQDLRLLEMDFLLKDRGYNKIVNAPVHLIYGSAEGNPQRFGDRYSIHNSIIGPWFNYGLIGLVCLLAFIKSTWRPTRMGWRIALALAPVLMFHNITHMFLPYFLLVAIALTANDDKVVSI